MLPEASKSYLNVKREIDGRLQPSLVAEFEILSSAESAALLYYSI